MLSLSLPTSCSLISCLTFLINLFGVGYRCRMLKGIDFPFVQNFYQSEYISSAFLFVFVRLDPPGPPQNLHIENLTSSSCTLVWEPPSFDGGSEIKGYYIERSSGYSSRFVKVSVVTVVHFFCKLLILSNCLKMLQLPIAVMDGSC